MVYHHDEGNSITQRLCWDEINRLIATSDGSQISHYIYDANGERAMKYNGTLSKQQINQYTLIDYALMDRYTYYPSPLLVFGSSGYSKHYFIEGQRMMSRIGDIWDAEAALIPLDTTPDGVDLNNKADQIEAQLETHLACLALAGEVDYHVDLEWLGWETEPIVFFYHPDHLGSSSFITGATGLPTQHLEYLPFGELFIEERSTWNTPYKFSGKELDDETGYSYFGARYYDPNISIWLSVDPLSDKYPSTSPFMYVRGNPIMLIDPNGMNDDDFYYNQQGELIRHDVNAQPDRFFVQNGTTRVDNPRDLTPNPQQMQVPTFEEVGMNSDLGHMARTIYAEGAGQSTEAKVALGEVIRNRANDNTAPSSANNYNAQFSGVSTYEEVVTQSGQFESVSTMAPRYSNPLSVTGGDGVGPRNMLESNAFSSSMGAAIKCTYTPTNTAQGATYFFSPYIRTPNWAKSMTPVSIPGVSSSDFRFYKY